jgi:lipoate-protein ligase A
VNPKSEIWVLLDSGPGAADLNMALDEALLELASQLDKPVLRFYGWTERAASFGYSQNYGEVARLTSLRPLVRRPTGGGLVPHDADWTYSLIFPPGHWWYASSATESYQRIHEWIRDAFVRLNMTTELSPHRHKELPGQCFVGAERFDVLWRGRKIAGAAQRRNRRGLLIQGSVQPPPQAPGRADWQQAMVDIACEQWRIQRAPFGSKAVLNQRAEELVRLKYSREEYNQCR